MLSFQLFHLSSACYSWLFLLFFLFLFLFQIIKSLEEDPAARSKNLTTRLNQIAAALENKVTDL